MHSTRAQGSIHFWDLGQGAFQPWELRTRLTEPIRKSPSASCRVWAPCVQAVRTWRGKRGTKMEEGPRRSRARGENLVVASHGAGGPPARLSCLEAPAGGRAPRAAPTFRRPPWGTPLRTQQEVVHRQRLERWPHLRGSEGSTETNIWEGSTLLHLQKKAGRRSEAFPGSRLADETKKAGSGGAGRPRGALSRGAERVRRASESGDQRNFLLKAGHASSATTDPGSPDCPRLADVAAPLWLPGFYPETPEHLQPASSARGAPLPRDAPRALSPPAGRTRLAPPSAPGGAAGRTSTRGPERGASGLAGDPAQSPAPRTADLRNNEHPLPPPLPHRTPAPGSPRR